MINTYRHFLQILQLIWEKTVRSIMRLPLSDNPAQQLY